MSHNRNTGSRDGWRVKEALSFDDQAPIERVDLESEKFERLIQQKGVRVRVYRTTYCPNVKSVDGAEHNIDCTSCNGSGFLDVLPICTLAVLSNQELEKMANVEGYVDGNSVLATFPLGVELQYFTLVELEDFTDIYFQRVMRTPIATSDTDILKYSAQRVNFLQDSAGVVYYEGQDFKIGVNGDIVWGIGRTPADNVIYTIHYEAKVQFRATRAIHVNRFSQQKNKTTGKVDHLKFQEQWLLTKEFLVKRVDQAGNELEPGPYDNHTLVED